MSLLGMGSELPTLGPFARLQTDAKSDASAKISDSKPQKSHDLNGVSSNMTAGSKFHKEGKPTIVTLGLTFSYPGIGETPESQKEAFQRLHAHV